MITVRPFRLADLARLDPPALTAGQLAGLQGLPLPPGRAYTAEEAGRPLGCAGVLAPPGGRVGRAWAILGEELLGRPLVLHRRVLSRLPAIAAELGLDRIEAAVRTDYPAGRAWLERLGFRLLGPAPPSGDPDFRLYARRFTAPLSF
ncbi:MAG: hypothetical protein QNJ30_12245 [Kiloniellales bacterium]|nr:hypothetical protein [Kiloniellales bacterium]